MSLRHVLKTAAKQTDQRFGILAWLRGGPRRRRYALGEFLLRRDGRP
jgi:hypothetical protein